MGAETPTTRPHLGRGGKDEADHTLHEEDMGLLGVVAVIAAMASVGAYAYWTTGGSGSGTATVGDTTDNLVIVGDDGSAPVDVADDIYPSGSAVVTFRIKNPNPYSVHVTKVYQDGLITNTNQGASPLCDTSWFSFDDVPVNYTIPANTTYPLLLDPALTGAVDMSDPDVDQNGCKGEDITLNLLSN